MPEYNVSKLKLPNGVVLNLSGGSTSTEWLSETTVSSGTTETNGIEYTISTTNYKDGTTDTTYNNTFTVKNGTSSRPGVVYLTSASADSSSASGTGDKTAATPLCVYNSIHDTDNALTLQNISAGTDDTTAYTITSSRLAYAVQAHDHLVEFSPSQDSQYIYDNTNKELKLNADIIYSYRDSTGHPGGHDLDIESTGYLEIPYGDSTNPGLLKLSSAAATSSSASGNSDYTAATPKAIYDSIHSTSNVMPSATATAGTDTTTGYTLTAARLKETIETFGGTTYDAIDGTMDLWNIPSASLSTDEKVISPRELATFVMEASGRSCSYRLPSDANLNDYTNCCHTYFCDTNSSNMTNLPIDVSCDGLSRGYFNLIPINIAIFAKGQILIAEDKDYIYFRRYRSSTRDWTAWRALGIPCMGPNILGSVYLTDNANTSGPPSAIQSVAASPECVYNSIHASGNAASESTYGVIRLDASTTDEYGTNDGYAATPSAVKSAFDKANSAYTLANQKATLNEVYGLGTLIPNNSNLNDYLTPGLYRVETASDATTISNTPATGSFLLRVYNIQADNYIRQEFIRQNSPGSVYVRNYQGISSGWTNWFEFVDSSIHASTSQYGTTQLTDSTSSTSTTTAATPNSVKSAYDLANSAYTAATTSASTSTAGRVQLSTSTSSTSTSLAATPSAVKSAYDLANSAYTAATTSASTSTAGRVQLSTSTSSTSTTMAATPSAVRSAYNLADSAYDLAADAMPANYFTTVDEVVTLQSQTWTASNGGLYYSGIISESSTFSKILSVTPVTINQVRTTDNFMPVVASGSSVGIRIYSNVNSFKSSSSSITVRIFGIAK